MPLNLDPSRYCSKEGMELKYLTIYPLPAFLTPLPLIPFTAEETTNCTNQAAKGA